MPNKLRILYKTDAYLPEDLGDGWYTYDETRHMCISSMTIWENEKVMVEGYLLFQDNFTLIIAKSYDIKTKRYSGIMCIARENIVKEEEI